MRARTRARTHTQSYCILISMHQYLNGVIVHLLTLVSFDLIYTPRQHLLSHALWQEPLFWWLSTLWSLSVGHKHNTSPLVHVCVRVWVHKRACVWCGCQCVCVIGHGGLALNILFESQCKSPSTQSRISFIDSITDTERSMRSEPEWSTHTTDEWVSQNKINDLMTLYKL